MSITQAAGSDSGMKAIMKVINRIRSTRCETP